jgi:hypothetical protein
MGKACLVGCCANKACCAESQKNKSLPSIPAAKDTGPNQQLPAVSATHIASLFAKLPPVERADLAGTKTTICAQPQLAVLCSFLI